MYDDPFFVGSRVVSRCLVRSTFQLIATMAMMHLVHIVEAGRMSVSVAMSLRNANMSVVLLAVHLRMVGVSDLLDDRVETVVLVGRVLDNTSGSVRFLQRVSALDDIAVAALPLLLVVAGVRVLDAIVELVLGVAVLVLFVVATVRAAAQTDAATDAASQTATQTTTKTTETTAQSTVQTASQTTANTTTNAGAATMVSAMVHRLEAVSIVGTARTDAGQQNEQFSGNHDEMAEFWVLVLMGFFVGWLFEAMMLTEQDLNAF